MLSGIWFPPSRFSWAYTADWSGNGIVEHAFHHNSQQTIVVMDTTLSLLYKLIPCLSRPNRDDYSMTGGHFPVIDVCRHLPRSPLVPTSPIAIKMGTTFLEVYYRPFCFPGFVWKRQKSSQIPGAAAIKQHTQLCACSQLAPSVFSPSIQLTAALHWTGRTRCFSPQTSRESSSIRRCRVADTHSSITRHNSSSRHWSSCICVGWPWNNTRSFT